MTAGWLQVIGFVLKLTVIAALGLAAARLAHRRAAALRHLILAGTLAALLALPLVSWLAPAVQVTLPEVAAPPVAAAVGSVSPPAAQVVPIQEESAGGRGITLNELVVAVWALGAVLFLLPLAVGLVELRRLRQSGQPWPTGQAAVPGRVRVLLHESVPGPMTFGVLRPVILMPSEAQRWPEAELRRALTHELEHTRRRDWASLCAARVTRGVYWFHPLVWMLGTRLELEAERACDDAVLRQADAVAYADQLVGFAERRLGVARPPVLALAGRTHLAARVGAVLNGGQRRGRAGKIAAVLVCAAAALLALAVAPLAGTQPQGTLKFDVAVVRTWKPGQRPNGWGPVKREPGRVFGQYATVSDLLGYAFDLTGSEPVEGLPAWAGPQGSSFGLGDHYFVDARMPASTTDAQAQLMMQSLLQDRFKLAWHWTKRPTKVLELVVAPGQLKLKRPDPAKDPKAPAKLVCPDDVSGCMFTYQRAMNMATLAGALSGGLILGRPVIDKTGLSGEYFVPGMTLLFRGSHSATVPDAITEVREVTGLELRPATDPIPVLVVDHVEKPVSDAGN